MNNVDDDIIIRDALEDDAEALVKYLAQITMETDFYTYSQAVMDINVDEVKKLVKKVIKSDNSLFLVVELKNQIIGSLLFEGGKTENVKHTGEFYIYVLKQYWDKGIASSLVATLLNWSKESKLIRKLNLKVRFDNSRAIAIFHKFGFHEEGRISRDYVVDEIFYESIIMGKDID